MTRQREFVEAERARDNARAQLAYEQAERRQWEAHYRAEHADYLAELEAERDEARGKLDKVRALVSNPPVFGDLAPARWYGAADMQRDVLAILDGKTGD